MYSHYSILPTVICSKDQLKVNSNFVPGVAKHKYEYVNKENLTYGRTVACVNKLAEPHATDTFRKLVK